MKRNQWSHRCCTILFLLTVCLCIAVTWHASGTLLDGDASSELVLAKHLSETNRILSADWFYSTELRVVNTQLVYAALFRLFDSWRMVRFVGATILQGILAASYLFMAKQAGMRRSARMLSASLILLPVSISYGRIVLLHSYYVPHLTFGFLIVGLLLSIHRAEGKILFRTLGMLLLSLLGGLGGLRQGFVTQLPLLGVTALYWLRLDLAAEGTNADVSFPKIRRLLFCALGSCAFFGAGYLINRCILSEIYDFRSYDSVHLGTLDPGALGEILYGFLHQFGFRKSVEGISLMGVCSLGGLFAGLYAAFIGLRRLTRCPVDDFGRFALNTFFPITLLVHLCIFFFSDLLSYYPLYFIPAAVWAIPMLFAEPFEEGKPYARRLLAAAVVGILAVNGLLNCAYLLTGSRKSQIYEGLKCKNPNLVRDLSGALEYIEGQNFTLGYSEFWLNNTVTEITNGEVSMIGVTPKDDNRLVYHNWLTCKDLRTLEPDRTFILLMLEHEEIFLANSISAQAEKSYADDFCVIYTFEDGAAMKRYLDATA